MEMMLALVVVDRAVFSRQSGKVFRGSGSDRLEGRNTCAGMVARVGNESVARNFESLRSGELLL